VLSAGYPADNTRYLLLDPPDPIRLLAVVTGDPTRAALYLERAMLVDGEGRRFEWRSATPAELAEFGNTDAQDIGAALLLSTEGLDRRGREWLASFVGAGGGLLIVAGPRLDPALASGLLGKTPAVELAAARPEGARRFEPADPRHPIFRPFGQLIGTLGQVRFRQTLRIVETPEARVLARFDDGTPALVEYRAGDGRVLAFASDLNNQWNDFPRQPTFVPFVHELANYLTGSRQRPRELLVAEVPPGVARAPGAASVPSSGRRVVVNVDPRESDPARMTPDAFQGMVQRLALPQALATPTPAAAREATQDFWWYAILIMLTLLAAEGWVGRRLA